jgi:hypothetical protein
MLKEDVVPNLRLYSAISSDMQKTSAMTRTKFLSPNCPEQLWGPIGKGGSFPSVKKAGA